VALGFVHKDSGKIAEAEEAYKAALLIWEKLARAYPDVVNHQKNLAARYTNLGYLYKEGGRPAEAAPAFRAAAEVSARLSRQHPDVADYQDDLAWRHHDLGRI